MITIISGTPGAGKTALVVDMMMEELKKGRKIFTIGIPKLLLNVHEGGDSHTWQDGTWLKIDKYDPALTKSKGIKSTWFPRGCSQDCQHLRVCSRLNEEQFSGMGSVSNPCGKAYVPRCENDCSDFERCGLLGVDGLFSNSVTVSNPCGQPYSSPDAGSLLVIDESHTDFPQRSSGKSPPPYVEALTVHRHQGLDMWFLTQKPSFLDPFIRGLSSRHIHLSLNAFSFTGSRSRYEWAEYQETVNKTSKMLASKSDYKPSPAVFPLYASATIHTKLDQKMPTILKMFIIFMLVFLMGAAFSIYRVKSRVDAVNHPRPVVSQVAAGVVVSSPSPYQTPSGGGAQRSGATSDGGVNVFTQLANVEISKPLISSCLATKTRCQCYTYQGVKIALPEFECRSAAVAPNENFRFVSVSASPAGGAL